MPIRGLKKIALKSLFSKAYIDTRLKLSPSYQRAKKKSAEYGAKVLPIGVAKGAYHSSKGDSFNITETILKIIQGSYASDSFYYAPWKEKARILTRQIVLVPDIQDYMRTFNLTDRDLADKIYQILRQNKNRQGSPQLARTIAYMVGG